MGAASGTRRIAIDYTAAIRQHGGIGRYTRGLVHALAKQPGNAKYILLVATEGDDPDLQDNPSVEIRHIPLAERYLNIAWHRAHLPIPKIEWFTGPIDIFHSPNFVLPPVSKARTVLTVHDLSFLQVPECAETNLRTYLSRIVPKAVGRADLVLADSESTRQDVISLMKVDASRVVVVPAGVEPRFRPIADLKPLQSLREKYRLGEEPFILSLGTLEPRKNFVGLMEAFALLRHEDKIPHRLVIGGAKGWLYEGIFDAAERLNIRDEVTFAGFIADEDLPALYNLADVFAFPTLYEGFGLPVLEAMASGLPVVTADNSCMPELVGDAALLIDAKDSHALAVAIRSILGDVEVRRTLIARGLERARKFSWAAAAEQLRAAYERLL